MIDQAPAAGTRIRAGERVTIYVGDFVEPEEPEPDDGARRRRPEEGSREGRGDLRRALLRARGLAALGRLGGRGPGGGRPRGRADPDRARRPLAARRTRSRCEPAGGLLGCDVAFPVLHGPFGEDGTRPGPPRVPRRPLRGAQRALRRGRDGQAHLQAAARLSRVPAGRVLPRRASRAGGSRRRRWACRSG